jgi:hypothetical protein
MTRRASRGSTRGTEAAADALLAWLDGQTARQPRETPPGLPTLIGQGSARGAGVMGAASEANLRPDPLVRPQRDPALCDARAPALAPPAAPLRLAHTDWLHHRLTISGPAAPVAALRTAAAGAGVIPWQLDLDRIEEDLFLLLASPPPPQPRHLSIAGARILAGQLRDAVARRQALAVARVGTSRACPFDLHALLPVPAALLRRGPDDPAALAWLWTHWGTTAALRHVSAVDTAFADDPAPVAGAAVFRVSFWSADWSPWRALAALAAQWPALHFALRPRYATP